MMKKSISVVVPNYNGAELLDANIRAVYNALRTSGITDFEIIIPDDASTDGSVGFIKENYPEIILIENPVNRGFSGNANAGIKRAAKDLVFLINTDVVLTEGYFVPLLEYFEDPRTFGVMGRIVSIDSVKIQDGAKYPDYRFADINPNTNYIYRVPPGKRTFSFFLSGANVLMDRSKLMYLGGFDEIYDPYYSEDVDLGLRAWRSGYRCYYEHLAVSRHPTGSTIKNERSGKVKVIAKRNKMLLHFIHLDGMELAYFMLILGLKAIFRSLLLDLDYSRSFFLFVRSIPRAIDSKARLKALQKNNDVNMSVSKVAEFIKRNIDDADAVRF